MAGSSSQTHDTRIPLPDELARQAQLPGILVAAVAVAPGGEGAQRSLPPRRCANVHDGGEAAAEHGREVDDALTQARRKPRRILVTPVCDPLGPCPLIGALRKHDRSA